MKEKLLKKNIRFQTGEWSARKLWVKKKIKKVKQPLEINIYKTDAALGYGQAAYLIRLDKSNLGYNYLCIGTKGERTEEEYEVGKVILDLADYYVTECYSSEFSEHDSPLHKTFLFQFFLNSLKYPR